MDWSIVLLYTVSLFCIVQVMQQVFKCRRNTTYRLAIMNSKLKQIFDLLKKKIKSRITISAVPFPVKYITCHLKTFQHFS